MSNAVRLRMSSIKKSFGSAVAIADGNLTVHAGEVHALMGANGAGKSTMSNILGGVVTKDGGEVLIDGLSVEITDARRAASLGIAFVHQELTTLPSMTVGENIFLGNYPCWGPFIDHKQIYIRSRELLARVGCNVDPKVAIDSLSTGDRQLVEIARALRVSPSIIIFDEPTSSLSGPEREKLFKVIAKLRNGGAAIIFISHFLDEVFQVCDKITVMRNGQTVFNSPTADTTMAEVVHQMLGSVGDSKRIRAPVRPGQKPFVAVEGLTNGTLLDNINLQIHPGEIVGLWGLLGSGRTELVRAMMGIDAFKKGVIRSVNQRGDLEKILPEKLRQRTGFVTEDRRGEGVILPFTVAENIGLPNMDTFSNGIGVIDAGRERSVATDLIKRLGIKATSERQHVGTLSGGNQQKVVFARWLQMQPAFYILDEPTRGLDTGAKTEILKLTVRLAEEGAAILFISSELDELMRVSDRYLVINRGRITSDLPGNATNDELMAAVSGPVVAMEAAE